MPQLATVGNLHETSIENLEQSRVMRYDMSDIRAFVDDDDTDDFHEQDKTTPNQAVFW
jgi:hypothetical protein